MNPRLVLQSAHVLREAALVTGSLVLVNKALAGGFIDHRYGFVVSGLGRFLVTSGNRLDDILDMGAQHGALAAVALAAAFRLTGSLTCLGRVCQNLSPDPDSKERGTMRISGPFVNYPAGQRAAR